MKRERRIIHCKGRERERMRKKAKKMINIVYRIRERKRGK